MCLAPVRLDDGTMVACRSCDLCRANRVNDLVGRCLAEQEVSSASLAVTLTYAGDVPEAALLRYADFQKMMKRLRKAGFSVRYIVAGEYGTKKGRAHWHCILFFRGAVPQVALDTRIEWDFWPHGFSYFQQPDYRGFRYVLKYALKQQGNDGASRALAMSKKPPLGHDFFMDLAARYVQRGLPIHSPSYSFSHVRDRNDKPRVYWLQGRMREMFLARYRELWYDRFGGEPPQTDWMVERYFDPIAKAEMESEKHVF